MRLYSKSDADYSNKLPRMRKAFGELPKKTAILDGELCLIDPRGGAHFYRLRHQMRTRWPEEGLLVFMAFDLLHQQSANATSPRSAACRKRLHHRADKCWQSIF